MHARVFSPQPAVGGSGLGFYDTYVNGRRLIGHGGDTNYFHSELGLLEQEGVGFFVSVNTGGKAALVPRHFVRAFMNHYFPARLPAVKPPDDFGTRAAKYAGHYQAIRHSYTRFEKVFGLLGGTTVAATGKNTLVIPDLFGHSAQYAEVAPARLPRGRRGQDGRVHPGRRRPGRGNGRPVRLHPLRQAALVRGPALPVHAPRALPPLLPDRPRLRAAPLEERQGGADGRPLGPAQPRRCSEPSIWSSSSPSRRSSPPA